MSDAVRSYTAAGSIGFETKTSRRRPFRWFLLLVIAAGLIWLYWSTRDTYPIEALVPRDQVFHLKAEHLLTSRTRAAESMFWQLDLLPEKYQAIPEWLGNDFGLPDWVLNNLISDVCYVSGKDFHEFSDVLVVTRMSRIGCLIERYHRFVDAIEDEYAGGLRLRRMVDANAYYAVRGRTLVFSPSREALIAALTLREGDAVESLDHTISATGGDLQGRIVLPDDDPLGQYMERADFVLSFQPESIQLACRGTVRPAWRAPLDRASAGGAPRPLAVPGEGSVIVAGDFNVPVSAAWEAVDEMAGGALGSLVTALPLLRGDAAREDAPWRAFATTVREELGSAFTLRWTGFDVNGMVPLPVAELYLQTRGVGLAGTLNALPGVDSVGGPAAAGVPYRDEDGVVHVPVGWGGVAEPVLEATPGGVRLALHPAHLALLPPAASATAASEREGHLYVQVRPSEVFELLRVGGRPYAEAGLAGEHTADSFDDALAAFADGSREIQEVRFEASYDAGDLAVDVTMDLNNGD